MKVKFYYLCGQLRAILSLFLLLSSRLSLGIAFRYHTWLATG